MFEPIGLIEAEIADVLDVVIENELDEVGKR